MMPILKAQGAQTMADFESLFDPWNDDPKKLDAMKQLGFYSDCFGKVRWWEPETSVTDNMARVMIAIAEYLVADEPEITERELELWIEYLGDLTAPYSREQAYKFYEAMSREGLFTESMDKVAALLGIPAPKPH